MVGAVMRRWANLLLSTLSLLSGAALALAQAPVDPTRPPSSLEAVLAGEAVTPNAPISSGLTSILRRAGGKPAAVIDGQLVELGGRVREAQLIRIDEDSVSLRGSDGEEVLMLTPGIEKKAVAGDRENRP